MAPPIRPGALAGPLALSVALHVAALAWLQPRGAWFALEPDFELSVRLAPVEAPALVPAPRKPRRSARSETAKTGPLPPPPAAGPPEAAQQPLRLRIVPSPDEFGLSPAEPGRPYTWPGELQELPFPPEGIQVRYPDDELRNARQGLVVVRLDIARSGQLERIDVVCGSPPFDAAVLEALRAARFLPPLAAQGRAVPAWMVLEFAFLALPPGDYASDRAEQALAGLQKDCQRRRE